MPFTPFAPAATGAGTQPYQFSVDGGATPARGDGRILSDVVTVNGNPQITSASANFTSADTGKTIMINGAAGNAAAPLVAIMTFVSATTVSLSVTPSFGFTNGIAVYGTDDRAAISATIAAAAAYATANNYFAEVLFGAKIYMLTSLTQSGNGSTTPTFNAQLPLPFPSAAGTTQKLIIALTGAGRNDHFQYWESTTPDLAGTCLVSTTTAPSTPDATFGVQSVIGGPSGSAGFTGSFANVKPVLRNLGIWCGAYTNQIAYDLAFVAGIYVDGCQAQIFAPTGVNGGNSPLLKDLPGQVGFQSSIGKGMRTPATGNNDDVVVPSFAAEGYEIGLNTTDHLTCGRLATIYVDLAVRLDFSLGPGGNASHAVTIDQWSCEGYNGALRSNAGGGAYCQVNIVLDTESVGPTYDVNDSGNSIYGLLQWGDTNVRAPVVVGAANLKVTSSRQVRAVQGAPAYASGTPFQNPWWQDAEIRLTGGTTSSVLIGPTSALCTTSVGTTTPVTFKLPAGWWFSITQTVAPTFAAIPS